MKFIDIKENFKRYIILERGLTLKTYKACVCSINMLIEFSKYDELKAFNTGTIREFLYRGTQQRGWESKTFRNHWQSLKTLFDWCIKEGILKKNPIEGIEKPKLKKTLPRCISHEDTLKILYYTSSIKWKYKLEQCRNEAIVHILLFTGLRLQEMLNLQTTDVNLSDASIFVRMGKGGKDRIIPIHPRLIPKLRGYFEERAKSLKPSQWFFTGIKSNKKLYQKDISRILKVISNESGVKFTAHMLRHTFGKLMVEADFNIYKLKEIMGHEQVTTTQRYVSIAPESIKRSFEQVKLL